jgi:hypothetical protein
LNFAAEEPSQPKNTPLRIQSKRIGHVLGCGAVAPLWIRAESNPYGSQTAVDHMTDISLLLLGEIKIGKAFAFS